MDDATVLMKREISKQVAAQQLQGIYNQAHCV
jgi:hypothetical protein